MKYLKDGEVNAIVSNFNEESERIANNCIFLNKTEDVTLRTNGLVIYGIYHKGNDQVQFTHNFKYKDPYVNTTDYTRLKPLVLNAWKKAYTQEAQEKMEEVKQVIKELNTNNTEESADMIPQEPVMTKEITKERKDTKIIKAEVKDMNAMQLAHKLRVELKLEGHYHVQMKIALILAWKTIKGEATNINKEVKPVAEANTYNATQEVIEPEMIEEVIPEPVEVPANTGYLYLKSFEINKDTKVGDAVFYYRNALGAENKCFVMNNIRNLVHLDRDFADKMLPKLIKKIPNDTIVQCYGDSSYLAFYQNENVSFYAKLRNIKPVKSDAAPSGEIA